MPKRPSRVTSSNTSGAAARGECGAGHSGLVLTKLPREAGLEQLHDLTGRPGVDVRVGAFADLRSQGSPHHPASRREEQTPAAGKKKPSGPDSPILNLTCPPAGVHSKEKSILTHPQFRWRLRNSRILRLASVAASSLYSYQRPSMLFPGRSSG